jgi:outer membrane protein assembly factor BamE
MMNKLCLLAVTACLVLSSACTVDRIPGVYRIDVQQGNVVTRDMVDQLRPGMTRDQVRFVMGSPMLTDTFNADRWDYYYSFQPGAGEREQRRVTVYFENDRFTRITGEVPAASAASPDTAGSVQVSGDIPNDRGFLRRVWDSLTDWGDDD